MCSHMLLVWSRLGILGNKGIAIRTERILKGLLDPENEKDSEEY